MAEDTYHILPGVSIPSAEISFTFSRSGGKGGQHVNKVNSKVTLWFNLESSTALSPEHKVLLRQRLAGRLNKQGCLHLVADRSRSQRTNREEAIKRFCSLLRFALHVEKKRRKTKPTKGSRKRRLKTKKKRSLLKKQRQQKHHGDE